MLPKHKILKLKQSLARRDRQLHDLGEDLEDSSLIVDKLRDENTDLQADFDHYKLNSEAEIQQWKDRCQQLECAMAGQQRDFDDKRKRLFKEIQRRERSQADDDAVQKSQVADLGRELANTRSNLEDARSSSRLDQQRILSLTKALDSANAVHRLHMEQSEPNRIAWNSQLRDVAQQRDSLRETLDFASTEHRLHMDHCQRQQASRDQRYSDLTETLDFATVEHRLHMDHCQRERTSTAGRIEDLTFQLSQQRTTRGDLQQDHDGLALRLSTVSRAYTAEEARRKEAERQLDLERLRYRLAMDAIRTGHDASGAFIQELLDENAGLSSRLSNVSKAYATEESQRKKAATLLDIERQRHQLALHAYRTGQDVSDAQIDHLMQDNTDLQCKLSTANQAYVTEEAQRRQAQKQCKEAIEWLEDERGYHRLARASYLAGQQTTDTFVDHLLGIASSQECLARRVEDMDAELLMDISLPEEFLQGSSSDDAAEQQPDLEIHDLQQVPQDMTIFDEHDFEESGITTSPSSTGNTTTNTPALTHWRSFSRSPTASPAPMTPGSVVLPRTLVLRKPDMEFRDDGTPGSIYRTGIVARRRLNT